MIAIFGGMIDERAIRERYEAIRDQLDERGRRLFAAAEARSVGRGGVMAVCRATGLARSTIERGLEDLDQPALPAGRVRRAGSGRRRLTAKDPTLLEDLRRLVEPVTLGDPMRPLLWVSKSHVKLAKALQKMGHTVSPNTVRKLLGQLGYGRRANRKANDGRQHADRDAQFEHINAQVLSFQAENQPVISVDTKKKELVGNYTNKGTEYRPEGEPRRTEVHDFENKELGKVVPYGVYDLADNSGWVSVGVTSDTAEFAVNAIRSWFDKRGRDLYPTASRLMITADCGGSNGARVRLWKRELQDLADQTGLTISVCHFPPGTSKWNKIEHRLFCHITQNWRARPLTSRLAVIELIAATTTTTGLTVECELDTNTYQKGIKVTAAEMATLNIERDAFHPEWNYTIAPRGASND
jgi:hypothetical protein